MFCNYFCLALYSFNCFIQLHTVRIYIYIFIFKNLFLATLESDDGYLCAKNCHGTVALNPLVGWFVKGASPHRKVLSMLGFSNVGMLALLKDTAVNQTCRKTGRKKVE